MNKFWAQYKTGIHVFPYFIEATIVLHLAPPPQKKNQTFT